MSKIHEGNYFTIPHELIESWDGKIAVYHLATLSGGASKLYMALSHFANRFKGRPFSMGDERLSKVVGLKRKQLGRLRDELRNRGMIKTKAGGGNILIYEVLSVPFMTTQKTEITQG